MMKYFLTRWTHTFVPAGSSAVDVANVIGSANVPLPPAPLWICGYEILLRGGREGGRAAQQASERRNHGKTGSRHNRDKHSPVHGASRKPWGAAVLSRLLRGDRVRQGFDRKII
jgi:hypothetical protein